MKWTIEVVPVPVTDIERAKRFYADRLGFVVDLDAQIGDGSRLVQLTPPGSGCSIHLNSGWRDMPPGSLKGCTIVVADAQAAYDELIGRGVDPTPVRHFEDGGWVDGPGVRGTPSCSSAIPTATPGRSSSTRPTGPTPADQPGLSVGP